MSVIAHDGMENCPTCGSIVCVVMDDEHEGTAHYEPVGQSQVERLRGQLTGAVGALAELVRLKDGPRDDAYRAAKDAAWEAARAIVGQRGGQ